MTERNLNEEQKENIIYHASCFIKNDNREEALRHLMKNYNARLSGKGGYTKTFKPRSFFEYIESILTTPMNEMFSGDQIKNIKSMFPDYVKISKDKILYSTIFNDLDPDFLDIYYNFINIPEEEQGKLRQLRDVLIQRNLSNPVMQRLYDIFRNALCFKLNIKEDFAPYIDEERKVPLGSYNLWTEKEIQTFRDSLWALYATECQKKNIQYNYQELDTLLSMFDNCFDTITKKGDIQLCPCCGLPVNEDGRCHSYITCDYHPYFGKHSNITVRLDPSKTYKAVKKGIQWFITRTGIIEYFTYLEIKNHYKELHPEYKVIQYPELDAKGDILIETQYGQVLIDLKDWQNPKTLATAIRKNPGAYVGKTILFIPKYRYDLYLEEGVKQISKELKKCKINGEYPRVATFTREKKYNVFNIIDEKINLLKRGHSCIQMKLSMDNEKI